MDKRLKLSKDVPMPLNNSWPKQFPWGPKHFFGRFNETQVGDKEEVRRMLKLSKDLPKLKLCNTLPKLFSWRPKGNSCIASTLAPSRQVCFIFFGSFYATLTGKNTPSSSLHEGRKRFIELMKLNKHLLGDNPSFTFMFLYFSYSNCVLDGCIIVFSMLVVWMLDSLFVC